LELFGFLKYYPFRTGDVLLPLAFSLVAPGALVSGVRARGPGRLRGCLPAIAVATIAALFVYSRQDRFVEFFAQLGEQGQRILQGEFAPVSALGPTARWIREHSPRDSVFATDPCLDEFWLETERAMVVNAMSAPANAHFFEWYARMRDLNGGREFAESSFSVCREIRPHFASLSAESLQALRARYGADYYLVESERPDLAGAQVFHTDRFFVYALPRLEPGGASSD
jgi:hypothetical protein